MKTAIIIMLIAAAVFILVIVGWILFEIFKAKQIILLSSNYSKIINAIHTYRTEMITQGRKPEVEYEDMKSLDELYKHVWGHKYKHILPPNKLEIIQKYIDD